MTTTTTSATPQVSRPGYRYLVVGFLALVYTFNFMDRQILSTLAEPIRKDLGLSDTALGALGGIAFALFYTVFGIPVAWLSDRFRRVWIMATACGVWSLFTAGCGLATNFTQLALSRMMVGIGEAGGSAPSYALISDLFPAKERGTALAIYSLGVPLGTMLGVALGAGVAAAYGWRMAFFVVGLPGVLLALIMLLLIREPARGGLDQPAPGADAHAPAPPVARVIAQFFANRTLVWTALGCGLSSFVGYAELAWNAPLLMRVKGMTLPEVSLYYSLVIGIMGVAGTLGSGWLADRLGQRDRRWYAWIPAIAYVLGLPALAGIIWAPTWQLALLFIAAPALLNIMYLAPALAVVQNAVPPAQRAMSGAILLFILNLIGLGGGPVFLGMVSDLAKPHFGDHSLLVGYAALAPVSVITILIHLASARSIARDKALAAAL